MKRNFVFSLLITVLSIASVTAQNLVHTFTEAQDSATQKEAPILMIFSGSDWCKPCIQLRETIISTHEFSTFVESELVLLELDFPYKKKNRLPREQRKHNDQMAAKYNPTGQFPLMVLINKEGEVIDQFTFHQKMTTEELTKSISNSI